MSDAPPGVDLLWIPLGAGAALPIVRWSGHAYERIAAARNRRPRCDLFHSALEVRTAADRYVVEMTPAWGPGRSGEGAVATGPVGFVALGRARLFRYEVHCWRDGVIPDRAYAVGGPRALTSSDTVARAILALAPAFPTATWGRDEFGTGDMWNSNSLIAWLLTRAGFDAGRIAPPPGGRAPGWAAGLVVASRPRNGGELG